MNLSHVRAAMRCYTPPATDIQRFAVLILLFEGDNGLNLLFEVRSPLMRSQPGEICLPGGRLEPGETPAESALRETAEELGINPEVVELLGELEPLRTPFQYELFPVIGFHRDALDPAHLNLNPAEVSSVFSVPLEWFLTTQPESHIVTTCFDFPVEFPYDRIPSGRDYQWKSLKYPIHFYPYEGREIWGMTARIILSFCDALKNNTMP